MMKYLTREGGGPGLEGKVGLIHLINDWEQLWFYRFNWCTWRICQLEYEWDRMIPGWEITAILLGVGFRVRVNRDWHTTEVGRELLGFQEAEKRGCSCPICGSFIMPPPDAQAQVLPSDEP